MKNYNIVGKNPVAKFFYKGASHTHPVRRTVIMTESKPAYFKGYELREGHTVRELGKAPIKTFSKNRIAKISDLDNRRKLRKVSKKDELNNSTLIRENLTALINKGA